MASPSLPSLPSLPSPSSTPAGWSLAITGGLTVNDLVRVAPSTLSVLSDRGVDARGGGGHTLADVARRHELALGELLDELRESATEETTRRDGYDGYDGTRSP